MGYDSDIALGVRLLRRLVDQETRPPLVRRQFQSLGRLHAELSYHGFRLHDKRRYGPEAGAQLFYLKDRVLVRIKTRGGAPAAGTPYWVRRSGSPHLTISILGSVTKGTRPDTTWDNEIGKLSIHGGMVNKCPLHVPGRKDRGLDESWADDTHFGFPASDLDDEVIDRLESA